MSRPDFDVARRQSTRDAIETQSPEDEGRKTAAMRALGLPKASEVSLNTHPFDWPALEATLEELRYIKLSECSPEIQGDIYCIPSVRAHLEICLHPVNISYLREYRKRRRHALSWTT